MNKIEQVIKTISLGLFGVLLMTSCGSDPLSPGIEYMPDMYRSPAIEEYVDYGEMKDRVNEEVAMELSARVPVKGTIPFDGDASKAAYNFPYPYSNDIEGYELSGAELVNPVVFTEEVYVEAKAKYEIFCQHCHGEKGDGQGGLVQKGLFPAPPAYSGIAGLTPGKMFHTLHFGKGNMGSHAGQLSKEERWELVHYVQTLVDGQFKNPFKEKKAAPVAVESPVEETPVTEENN